MRLLPETPDERKRIALLLGIALILRLAVAIWVSVPLISDDRDYHALGVSLAEGKGFVLDGEPTAYRTPGYPLILAALYAVFGPSTLSVTIFQAFAGTFSCLLLYLLGVRLLGRQMAFSAAAVFALFPLQIMYVPLLLTETVFTTMLLLMVAAVVEEDDVWDKPLHNIVLGLLIGLMVLVRTVAGLLPLIVFWYRFRGHGSWKRNIAALCYIAVGASLLVGPWILRNHAEFGQWTMTNNMGINFWMGNHHGASGGYSYPTVDNPLESAPNDFVRSEIGTRLALEFIRDHPLEEAYLVVKKFGLLVASDYHMALSISCRPELLDGPRGAYLFRQIPPWTFLVHQIPFAAVLLLALVGLILAPPEQNRAFFLLRAIPLYWLVVHLIYYGGARYRFPIDGLLILAAVYGWHLLRTKTYYSTRVRKYSLIMLLAAVVAAWGAEQYVVRTASPPPTSSHPAPSSSLRLDGNPSGRLQEGKIR